jgi:aminobenzoyl-glutamate transport protein
VLARSELPPELLLGLFVLVVVLGDFALSGMLSKFGALAPVFIPMFMLAGVSPEATTAAYRIGDSVVNVVTPLNSYVLVILAVLQRYRPGAGIGSLAALMIPYSAALGVAWTALLLAWVSLGLDVGPAAPIEWVAPR